MWKLTFRIWHGAFWLLSELPGYACDREFAVDSQFLPLGIQLKSVRSGSFWLWIIASRLRRDRVNLKFAIVFSLGEFLERLSSARVWL
jgi:hypothetical protein